MAGATANLITRFTARWTEAGQGYSFDSQELTDPYGENVGGVLDVGAAAYETVFSTASSGISTFGVLLIVNLDESAAIFLDINTAGGYFTQSLPAKRPFILYGDDCKLSSISAVPADPDTVFTTVQAKASAGTIKVLVKAFV